MENQAENKEGQEAKNVFSGLTEDDDLVVIDNEDTDKGAEGTEGAKGTGEGDDDGDDGGKGDGDDGGKGDGDDGGEGEGDDGGDGDGEGDDDDFDPDNVELKLDDDQKGKEGDEAGKEFNYLNAAKKLGVNFDEDPETFTEEEFYGKITDHIESSKQQFSYKDVAEENQDIVRFFAEEGGSVADLLSDDDVVLASSLLQMTNKDKFTMTRSRALMAAGLDKAEAEDRVSEELESMSEKELAQAVDNIDNELERYKKSAINKHIELRKNIQAKKAQRETEKAQAERKTMVSTLNSMDRFMGMKLTPDVKAAIAKDIENGNIDKSLGNAIAKAKVESYLLNKFGKQISEYQEKLLKTSTAKSYNKGVKKFVDKNHNHSPESRERSGSKGEKPKWSGFKDID